MYIVFLDEFGHIGPFVSRSDPKFNQNPVFGVAGIILPHSEVRAFATWFYQNKNNLLNHEITRSGIHPATWEKKGADLFTTRNVEKFNEVRQTAFRMINRVYRGGGHLFFYGREKYQKPVDCHTSGLYTTVLGHAVRQLDRFCSQRNEQFMVILDQHSDRVKLLAAVAKTMFGDQPARCLIEPPFQAESHLYQTLQAADWVAALFGRLHAYRVRPEEFKNWSWSEKYFGRRLNEGVTHSTMWRPRHGSVS